MITLTTVFLLFALRIPLPAKVGLIIVLSLIIWSFIDLIRGTDKLVFNSQSKLLKIHRSHLGQKFNFEGLNNDYLRLQLEEEPANTKTNYVVYLVFYNKKARLIYELANYSNDKESALQGLNNWRQKLKIDDDIIDIETS